MIHAKDKLQCIYAIRHVSGRRYIGSTNNLNRRMREHKKSLVDGDHTSQHFLRAYRKYGEESFTVDILELVANIDDLWHREQFWIDSFHRRSLYNSTVVVQGNGRGGGRRRRLKAYLINKDCCLEFNSVIEAAGFLRAGISRVRNAKRTGGKCRGWYVSKEPTTISEIENKIRLSRKPIYCFSKSGNLLRVFRSLNEAASWVGSTVGVISLAIHKRGRSRTAWGYQWSLENVSLPFTHAQKKRVRLVGKGYSMEFDSQNDACNRLGLKKQTLSGWLKKGIGKNGVKWEYVAT